MKNNNVVQVTGGTGTSNTYEDYDVPSKILFKLALNSFVFYIDDKEIMRINSEGFFWKDKLIENDKEIYQKFNKYLNMFNL